MTALLIADARVQLPVVAVRMARIVRGLDRGVWFMDRERYDAIVWWNPQGSYLPTVRELRRRAGPGTGVVIMEDARSITRTDAIFSAGAVMHIETPAPLDAGRLLRITERASFLARRVAASSAPAAPSSEG